MNQLKVIDPEFDVKVIYFFLKGRSMQRAMNVCKKNTENGEAFNVKIDRF